MSVQHHPRGLSGRLAEFHAFGCGERVHRADDAIEIGALPVSHARRTRVDGGARNAVLCAWLERAGRLMIRGGVAFAKGDSSLPTAELFSARK